MLQAQKRPPGSRQSDGLPLGPLHRPTSARGKELTLEKSHHDFHHIRLEDKKRGNLDMEDTRVLYCLKMVRPERFELPTFWFVGRESLS
jgi:hypothetical protein